MSLEAYTFKQEIDKIDNHRQKLLSIYEDFTKFILSEEFLADWRKFNSLLSNFSAYVTSMIRYMQNLPLAPLSTPTVTVEQESGRPVQTELTQKTEKTITMEKAAIIAVAIVALSITVSSGLLPALTIVAAVGFILALIFAPQLKSLIVALLGRKMEEPVQLPLEDWIRERLGYIRKRYEAIFLLTKVHTQTKEDLPNYQILGIEEILYNRKKQEELALSSEILTILGDIVTECDRNLWERRSLIISALSFTRQATATLRGVSPS